ncbi:MAG: hypothetical protein GXY55_21860 [Phycisphaerae bacterium]|nr:hypothetical protein [Phycisphaerae bacterium]
MSRCVAISLLLVALGHLLVPQRVHDGPNETMTIRGDSLDYIAMVEGDWTAARSPFRYRVLAPFLAGLLPLSPTDALRCVTYVSLCLTYVVALLACKNAGLGVISSMLGLVLAWASPCHLYSYHNPFLTDALALFMLGVMVYALFRDSFALFLAAAVLGILTRETTIVAVPVWAIRRGWRHSVLLLVVSAAALLVPRYILGAEAESPQALLTVSGQGMLANPWQGVMEIVKAWGAVWLLSVAGLWCLPQERCVPVRVAYAALLCGATLVSLVAADTGRMFAVLFPVHVITLASLSAAIAWKIQTKMETKRSRVSS